MNLPVAYGKFDAEGELICANKRWLKLFETEIPILPKYQLHGQLTSEYVKNHINEALRLGESCFEIYASNPNTDFICASVTLQCDEDGTFSACAHDISYYKSILGSTIKREQDEKKALDLARRFLDAAPIFIETWDNEMNLTGANQAAVKMFGLRDTDHYIEVYDKLHPEFQPCGMKTTEKIPLVIEEVMKNGYTEGEWMHIDIDGNPVPVQSRYVRFDVGNDEHYIVGYSQDLRPIRAAMSVMENAMDEARRASELSQMYLDAAPFFVEIWDCDLNLKSCNVAAVKMFGLSGTHEYVRIFDELSPEYQPCGTPSDEKIKKVVSSAFEEGYARIEWIHLGIDGQPFPMDVVYVKLNNGEEDIVVGYNQDLRPLKTAMDKLSAAEEANRAKSSFLSTISHEIRTPLNAILGITEIRLMDKDIDPQIRDDLMKIYTSSDVLLKIINDILDLSKIEAGKLSIIEREYETASLIGDTVQLNIMRLDSKPVEFVLLVDEELPTYVLGDDLRMKQIFSNLLSNAFKYTEEGKVTIDIRTHDLPDCNDRFLLEMKVADTGVGLSQQQIENLFEEFSRFNESESSPEGTGLGMSITKKLVSLMGGKLSVESEVGKGSTFTASIPQGKVVSAKPLGKEMVENLQQFRTVGTQTDNTDITRELMPYGKILVVDDVEINIYVVMGLLMPYELQVDDASNGMEAIEKVKNGNEYDIIFMDHMMPEMDGIEATRIIRDMGYSKPIVALTANAVSGQAEMFLKNGFDDFISKPIDVRNMNLILNRLIRDRRPPMNETGTENPLLTNTSLNNKI